MATSMQDYLKRYNATTTTRGDDEVKVKPKKKRKVKGGASKLGNGVVIVDDDGMWQKERKPGDDDDEPDEEADKPTVIEEVDVKVMQRMEALKSHRPYLSVANDGSGWVTVKEDADGGEDGYESEDRGLSELEANRKNEYMDSSLPRKRNDSPDTSPPRRTKELDLSPSRGRNNSPGGSDSPIRRKKSPERRGKDLSPPRRRNDSPDISPPRRSKDLSPPRRSKDLSPTRRRNDSLDISPPRGGKDLSPPRRRNDSLDISSPRRGKDLSSPRRRMTSQDMSPPRRMRDSDLSPPRRRNGSSTPGRRKDADSSPPRGRNLNASSDLSPPRKSKFSSSGPPRNDSQDLSPPRKRATRFDSPDLSPPRKQSRVDDEGAPKAANKYKMSDGSGGGLRTDKQVNEEIQRKKAMESKALADLDPSQSGRGAETVYRDKRGRRLEGLEELLRQQKGDVKAVEAPLEWGKGLAQKREMEARFAELEAEKNKPFARTRDDAELDKSLKERVRWGDPMAHLVKTKMPDPVLPDFGAREEMKASGFIVPQDIPSHSWLKRGIAPPANRYGIKPGRHWDGVDRSTGYERDMFKARNEKKALEQEAYLWSVADM